MNGIHETAIVDKGARIGEGVKVAPFAVIEDNVRIGDGCEIGAHAMIASGTRLGPGCRIFNGASVGTIPQDLKFKGEDTLLEIGENTIIREFCTINRGTEASGKTVIGKNGALLAYCHVAHDCVIGDNFISSNNLAMGGHVTVGDNVGIGGIVSIHQFCRIGDHAFIAGGGLRILKDVVPFAMCGGDPGDPRIYGTNKVGLERRGFDEDRRNTLKRAFKTLFREGLPIQDAIAKLNEKYKENKDINLLIEFVENSERGLIRHS